MPEAQMVEGDVCESPAHLSPSSIGTWQQCPLRFRYGRLDKIPEPSTEPQILGSFVHEVLENLYMQPVEGRTKEEAKRIASRLWVEKWEEETDVLRLDPEALHQFRWRSWWCIEALWSIEDPQKVELAGIEQKLSTKIGDAKLLGILDRYHHLEDGSVMISDYKTGKKPKARFEEEKRFQLTVYVDLVESCLEERVSGAELLYLKDGVKWEFMPTPEDVLKMRETVIKVWSEIQTSCSAGTFLAKPTILCDWCNYKPFCPVWQ
jgi:putative RecB family exonuclease